MRRIGVVVIVIGLMTMPFVFSQGVVYRPGCVEVLRLTPAEFTEHFVKRSGDSSELGYDSGALYWANCKHQSNLRRLATMPALRNKILKLRDLESQLLSADANIAALRSGGGSVFSRGRARAQASLEAHIGRVIALSGARSGTITNPAIRKRFTTAMTRMDARIKRLQQPGNIKQASQAEYTKAVEQYRAAYRGIREQVTGQVNVIGLEIIEFAARGLFLE